MPVDRTHWRTSFRKLPPWDCPTCGKGHLKPVAETWHEKETGPSSRARHHYEWEPDWIKGRFASLLECDFDACKEIASISGNYQVEEDVDFDYEGVPDISMVDFYQVLSISPSPLAIRPIKGVPKTVSDCLERAAALLWRSEEAAANSIRQAVERLMDAKKIKKQVLKKGKVVRLSLHTRIEAFQKTDELNGDILLAVKWLGNSGSHVGDLKRSDVLDAFDFVELALDNLYGTTKDTIMKKVKAVNKKKGPTPN